METLLEVYSKHLIASRETMFAATFYDSMREKVA